MTVNHYSIALLPCDLKCFIRMSSDLEKKRTSTSMMSRAITKENGDIIEIRDKDVSSPSEADTSRAYEEKKLLRKIDLW